MIETLSKEAIYLDSVSQLSTTFYFKLPAIEFESVSWYNQSIWSCSYSNFSGVWSYQWVFCSRL